MKNRFYSKAFVIKKKNVGESDQIITLYSKNFGKIDVLGKGIRKINSKLKSGIDELSEVYIEFIETSRRKTLVESKIIYNFSNIKKETEKFLIIDKIKELIDSSIKEEEKDFDIWILIKELFIKLEKSNNYFLYYYYFFWNFISYLGYRPSLENCFICQKKLKIEEIYFLEGKGFIDFNCSKNKKIVSSNNIKLIKFFLNNKINKIDKISKKEINITSLEDISNKLNWFFS